MSPFKNTDGCHSWEVMEFEATYLVAVLTPGPVPAGAKMVVIFKARIEHGVSLGLSHAVEFAFVVVAKTEVFHCSSPLPSGWVGASGVASGWLVHPMVKTVHIPKLRRPDYSVAPFGSGEKRSSRT